MSKYIGSTLLFFVLVGAFCFGIWSSMQADKVSDRKHDFQVVCEFRGGHIATLDEGENFVCIKGGKVIDRG